MSQKYVEQLEGNSITFTHIDWLEHSEGFYGFNQLKVNNVADKAIDEIKSLYSNLRVLFSRTFVENKRVDETTNIALSILNVSE